MGFFVSERGEVKRKYILLICIGIIAAIFRFYQLGTNPPSLTWDEAAWGYNAYSLLNTGRDEFGKFLPITYLESFGDFKPPIYAYLTTLPVLIFGLNEFSTRFASAFFGTVTVIVTYFLVANIFFNSQRKEWYALLAALLLAVSPWHINLSRAAFEANVATFFLVSGVALFLQSVLRKPWLLPFSSIAFVLSMYTFNTSRIVAPLLGVFLVMCFHKKLFRQIAPTITAFAIMVILLAPLVPFLLSPQAKLRFEEVNIFTDSKPVAVANEQIARNKDAFWAKIIENRRVFYALEYTKHYLDNLSPSFLFIRGDGNPKFSTQQVGQMYIVDMLFLAIGALLLFKKREGYWYLLPIWLLLGIVPAATARETPHALRIETILPIPQIFVAYGLVSVIYWLSRKRIFTFKLLPQSLLLVFLFLLGINVLYYVHDYYAAYRATYSGEWQYGYKDAFAYAKQNEGNYRNIFITDELGRPYAYYLFYSKLSPFSFQQNATVDRDAFGFVNVNRVGSYYFGEIPQPELLKENTLYIVTPEDVPEGAEVLQAFRLLNGNASLVAYKRAL